MNFLKEAIRSWRHRKMLAFFSFVIVSVGIGVNASVFSWIYRILSDPFSLEGSDRLVLIGEAGNKASLPNFEDWRRLNATFESMAAFRPRDAVLKARDGEDVIRTAEVTTDFFRVLRIEPYIGRTFATDDTDAAILSYGLWRSRFSGDPKIVGQRIPLQQKRPMVVGVLPPSDPVPPLTQAWIVAEKTRSGTAARLLKFYQVVGRLKDGISLQAAQQDMTSIGNHLARLYPEVNSKSSIQLRNFVEAVLADARSGLMPLFASTGMIMIFACMSGASLLLARSVSRREEIALRMTFGASRTSLLWLHLAENLVLTLSAGIAGLMLAKAGARWLLAFAPIDSLPFRDLKVHPEAVIFTLALSALTGVILSALPFLETARSSFLALLRGSATGPSLAVSAFQRWMAVLQTAMSCMLLITAALMAGTLWSLSQVDTGFDHENVVVFTISRPGGQRVPIRDLTVSENVLRRIEAQPGVASACSMRDLPMEGVAGYFRATGLSLEGDEAQIDSNILIEEIPVTPNYFKVMGIPLVAGRSLEPSDQSGSEPVAVVNEAFVRLVLHGRDPIGKKLRWDGVSEGEIKIAPLSLKVVGIAYDTRQLSLTADPEPQFYVPLAQHDSFYWGAVFRSAVAVRIVDGQLPSIQAIRELTQQGDGQVESVRTMREIVSGHFVQPRAYMLYLGAFAAFALLLTAAAVFSMAVHWMKTRQHEIGVRMALGAGPSQIRTEALAPIAKLVVAGVVLGLSASYFTGRLLNSALYGVTSREPAVFLFAGAFVLALSLLVACSAANRSSRSNISWLLRSG